MSDSSNMHLPKRSIAIASFAACYPIAIVLLRNIFWRDVDPLLEALASAHPSRSTTVLLLFCFAPPVASFLFLPVKPLARLFFVATSISVVYLAVMAPLTFFISFVSYCSFNHHCLLP